MVSATERRSPASASAGGLGRRAMFLTDNVDSGKAVRGLSHRATARPRRERRSRLAIRGHS